VKFAYSVTSLRPISCRDYLGSNYIWHQFMWKRPSPILSFCPRFCLEGIMTAIKHLSVKIWVLGWDSDRGPLENTSQICYRYDNVLCRKRYELRSKRGYPVKDISWHFSLFTGKYQNTLKQTTTGFFHIFQYPSFKVTVLFDLINLCGRYSIVT
jgi:hypothetical protein